MTVMNNSNANGFFFKLVYRIERAIEARRAYKSTVRELRNLSDRELLDLNLSRADIERVAREAANPR